MAAQEVVMPNGARAKVRDEGLVLLWTVLTLGIYNWVWYYRINREMRDFGRAHGDEKLGDSNPVLSVLAVTIGSLLIVPPLVSWWKCTGRIRRMQGLCNVEPLNGWVIGLSYVVGFFLFLTLFVIPPYVQTALNKVWKLYPPAEGEGDEVELTAGAPAPSATPAPTEPPAAS
jgi:Domain of unknown function (DUF4234)